MHTIDSKPLKKIDIERMHHMKHMFEHYWLAKQEEYEKNYPDVRYRMNLGIQTRMNAQNCFFVSGNGRGGGNGKKGFHSKERPTCDVCGGPHYTDRCKIPHCPYCYEINPGHRPRDCPDRPDEDDGDESDGSDDGPTQQQVDDANREAFERGEQGWQ